MTVQMNPGGPQLVMLLFVLAVLIMLVWIAVRAIGRCPVWQLAASLAGLVILYAAALVAVALATNAGTLRSGDEKCFDEWCASMLSATMVPGKPAIAVRVRLADHGSRNVVLTLVFNASPAGQGTRFVVTEAASGEPTPGAIVIGDESSPFHPISGWPLAISNG